MPDKIQWCGKGWYAPFWHYPDLEYSEWVHISDYDSTWNEARYDAYFKGSDSAPKLLNDSFDLGENTEIVYSFSHTAL